MSGMDDFGARVPVPVHDLFFAHSSDPRSGEGIGTRKLTGKHAP